MWFKKSHLPSLDAIGLKHGTDKASNAHNYLHFYDRIWSPLRAASFVLIEVGVYEGASVATWAEYFSQATIIGLDVDAKTKAYEKGRVKIRIGDASDPVFISSVVEEFGRPLIVIDDGSHAWPHQIATLQLFFPSLRPGGFLVIEDLHTSFGKLASIGYDAGTSMSGYDYLQALTRNVNGFGWMGHEKPFDSFIETNAPLVESIEWARSTCAIRKAK